MYFCDLCEVVKPQIWTVWTAPVLFFVVITGVNISPCDDNGVREVLVDQDTVFTCTAEGQVEWRFEYSLYSQTVLLAKCESTCEELNSFNDLFKASIVKARHSSSLTIRARKHQSIVHLTNGSLLCYRMNGSVQVASARCGLHYVYRPENVSCTAVNTSWIVTVSCYVASVYSSRGLYTCQLYRLNQASQNKSLETVTMLTSPTNEYIGEKEVMVSGFCQFNTTLPTEEGQYAFHVFVSPGGRTYYANFPDKYNWISTERPSLPRVSCGPQQYVLENTSATCTCNTSSLGQPAGYLIWIIGDQRYLETTATQGQQNFTSHELHHTHFFTQADHGRTWFRCDVVWGLEKILGENYTVKVGYASRPSQFVLNGNKENQTVNEGNQVNFVCKSDGRPTPNISIYNNDNDTAIIRDVSPVNYTFIARCEDTATYTCSAWNEFSRESGVTSSVSLDLNVRCKPRSHSSTQLGFYMMNHQTEMNFDIIAYPVPHEYHVWLIKSPINNSEDAHNEVKDTMVNITCQSVFRRYLSTCSLRVVNINSLTTGSYKVQVINEAGDENFTVKIDFSVSRDQETHYTAVTSGVVCVIVFIFTIVVVIVIIRKRKERKAPLRIHTVEAEATPFPTQPEPCQTPLYAVVDKTKKKRNPQPALSVDTEEQMEKESKQGIEVPEPSLPPTCQVLYAVVDKTKKKSPVRRKEGYSTEDSKRKSDDLGDYQNIMDPHSAQDEDYVQLDVRSPASRSHTVDDGRWLNSAGLLYTFPTFDVGNGVRCRPPPTHEETEYCALRLMADAFPAIGRKSND